MREFDSATHYIPPIDSGTPNPQQTDRKIDEEGSKASPTRPTTHLSMDGNIFAQPPLAETIAAIHDQFAVKVLKVRCSLSHVVEQHYLALQDHPNITILETVNDISYNTWLKFKVPPTALTDLISSLQKHPFLIDYLLYHLEDGRYQPSGFRDRRTVEDENDLTPFYTFWAEEQWRRTQRIVHLEAETAHSLVDKRHRKEIVQTRGNYL